MKKVISFRDMKKLLKTTITGTLIIATGFYFAFHTGTRETQAQQTPPTNIRVTCAPDKEFVLRNSPVKFTATVQNATSTIIYSWRGANITSRNAPDVTAQYGSLGVKRATTTINTGGVTLSAGCSVTVVTTLPGGSNQGGNQQNPLGNLPQGGNQTGNQSGNNNSGGQQSGGNNQGTPIPQTQPQREEAARQQARQNYEREQQQAERTFEQEKQQCEEGETSQGSSDSIKDSIEGDIAQDAEMFGQMVPTDPKPIVDPIKNIRENIERLTAKEIGLKDSQEPPLDQKVACKADAAIKKIAEQSRNFLSQGRDGNPYWITDYNALIKDSNDIGRSRHITALANDQSCKSAENKKIAQALASVPRSIIGAESTETSCPMNQNKDLNDLNTYLSYSDPLNNPAYRFAEKYSAMISVSAETVDLAKYETEINNGFIGVKDENGKIINPPNIYANTALFNINNEVGRLGSLHEITDGESVLFENFLGKTGIDNIAGVQEGNSDLPA